MPLFPQLQGGVAGGLTWRTGCGVREREHRCEALPPLETHQHSAEQRPLCCGKYTWAAGQSRGAVALTPPSGEFGQRLCVGWWLWGRTEAAPRCWSQEGRAAPPRKAVFPSCPSARHRTVPEVALGFSDHAPPAVCRPQPASEAAASAWDRAPTLTPRGREWGVAVGRPGWRLLPEAGPCVRHPQRTRPWDFGPSMSALLAKPGATLGSPWAEAMPARRGAVSFRWPWV